MLNQRFLVELVTEITKERAKSNFSPSVKPLTVGSPSCGSVTTQFSVVIWPMI